MLVNHVDNSRASRGKSANERYGQIGSGMTYCPRGGRRAGRAFGGGAGVLAGPRAVIAGQWGLGNFRVAAANSLHVLFAAQMIRGGKRTSH